MDSPILENGFELRTVTALSFLWLKHSPKFHLSLGRKELVRLTQFVHALPHLLPVCFRFRICRSHVRLVQRDMVPNVLVLSLATRGPLDVRRLKSGLDVHPTLIGMGQPVDKLALIFRLFFVNDDRFVPIQLFLVLKSWWWRFLFSSDRHYDAWKQLVILRWLLRCFDTDNSTYIVIQVSYYFLFCHNFVVLL